MDLKKGRCCSWLLTLFLVLIVNMAFSQNEWGLPYIKGLGNGFTGLMQTTATRAKYSDQNNPAVLYNLFYDFPGIRLSIKQLSPYDYPLMRGTAIMTIFRDSAPPVPGSKNNTYTSFYGSSSNYARDFASDLNEQFIILADNKGNGWDIDKPVTSLANDSSQLLLCKVGMRDQLVWHKIYGGSSAEYAVAIQKMPDGNFLVLAQTQSGDGDVKKYYGGKDIWLLKISGSDGSISWQKTIGTNADEIPTDMKIMKDGSIIVCGTAENSSLFPSPYAGLNSFLLKLDQTGNIQWSKTFGGSNDDKMVAVCPTLDGGYATITNTGSSDGDYTINNGGSDVYIMRHDVSGNILWKKHYGFANDDLAGDIAVNSCDSTIYASFSTAFASIVKPYNVYPAYSQNQGVKLAISDNAVQKFYFQDDDIRYYGTSSEQTFNFNQVVSLTTNSKGGILALYAHHLKWGPDRQQGLAGTISRSWEYLEFGTPVRKITIDTIICEGQPYNGTLFLHDTLYSDTLRTICKIDTLITSHKVRVMGDSIIVKDSIICFGDKYNGVPVYTSFIQSDSTSFVTSCGLRYRITTTHFNVTVPASSHFPGDTLLCPNEKLLLHAAPAASSYLWQDGSTQASYTVQVPGQYWVSVTDSFHCKQSDTVNVNISDLYLTMAQDTTLNNRASATLTPITNGTVVWNGDPTLSCNLCTTTVASPKNTTTYFLVTSKDGCQLKGQVKIRVEKDLYIYVPNAFTPNNDNKNDQFKVKTNISGSFYLSVYNRYGQPVFTSSDPANGWAGSTGGILQPAGAYVYIIKYTNKDGRAVVKKGSFLLIR